MYLVVMNMQGRILDFQKGGWYMGVECAKVGHYRGVRECGRGSKGVSCFLLEVLQRYELYVRLWKLYFAF